MFCKWCGETVKEGEKRCGKCLRELPPLSECGGFYNLYQEPQEGSEPLPKAVPVSARENEKQPPASTRGKKRPAGSNAKLWRVVCAVLAIVCLLFLIQTLRIGHLNRRIESLEAAISEQTAAATAKEAASKSLEEMAELEDRIAGLEAVQADLESGVSEHRNMETTIENGLAALDRRIAALETAAAEAALEDPDEGQADPAVAEIVPERQ